MLLLKVRELLFVLPIRQMLELIINVLKRHIRYPQVPVLIKLQGHTLLRYRRKAGRHQRKNTIDYMKKTFLSAAVLILCIFMSSCQKKQKEDNISQIPIQRVNANMIIFPNGVLFDYEDVLYILDAESGMVAPVCNKIECLHEPPSSKNPEPACYAAYPGISMYHAFYLGKECIFTLIESDLNQTTLYQSDLTGENRRKALVFEYELESLGVYSSDGIYYNVACYREYEEGEAVWETKSEQFYLIRVDMEKASYEVVPSPFENRCTPIAAVGDMFYMVVSDPYEGEYGDQSYYDEWAQSIRTVCFDWKKQSYQTVFTGDIAVGGQYLYHAEENSDGSWTLERMDLLQPNQKGESVYSSSVKFEYKPVGNRFYILDRCTQFQTQLVLLGDLGKKCFVFDKRNEEYGLISWEDYEKNEDCIQYIDLYPKE